MKQKMQKIAGVYRIVSPSGKFYIGSSINLRARQHSHWSSIKHGTHQNKKLTRSFKKYGSDAMRFEVIFCTLPGVNTFSLEQEFMDELKPQLNMSLSAWCPAADPNVRARMIEGIRNSEKSKANSVANFKIASEKNQKVVVRSHDFMEFESAVKAAAFMKYPYERCKVMNSITSAIRQRTRCNSGYFWKLKEDPITFEELDALETERETEKVLGVNRKAVVRLPDGKIFSSAKQAARYYEIKSENSITLAIQRKRIVAGHRWEYANDPTARLSVKCD